MANGQRFLVVTAFDTNYEVGYLCSVVTEAYCQRNGYGFRRLLLSPEKMKSWACGRHLAWSKVALLGHLLEALFPDSELGCKVMDFEYIVWIDADAMVLDHAIQLQEFVELAKGADFIIGEDMADTDLLNTGLMFFRCSSKWCKEMLRRWWSDSDPQWHNEVCWDQTGLCRLLSQDGFGLEKLWYSWAGGLRYKCWRGHIFVIDCGSFNFKYLNNCSFVFHAVGERELLLSFTQRLLLKKDRLYMAVREGFVAHGQDVLSPMLDLSLLLESEVEKAQVSLSNALQFWRSFGMGKRSKKTEPPPLGWGQPTNSYSLIGCQLPSTGDKKHLLELGPLKLEAAWISHQHLSFSPADLAKHVGDLPVHLLRSLPPSRGPGSFATRLWQFCSYISGDLPPFGPLGFTAPHPWRLSGLPWKTLAGAAPELGQLGTWRCPVLEAAFCWLKVCRQHLILEQSCR